MADYNNTVFKPRKDSGFVIKFRLTPDKADEKQKDREQHIARWNSDPYAGEALDFHKTFYIRKTFNSIAGVKNSTHYFTAPWYYDDEDFIAFIYKVNDYDFPCAAYMNGKFVEFNNLSDEDCDLYRSYSGSYVEEVCPLWIRENKFKI
jgi:hypothetical protein